MPSEECACELGEVGEVMEDFNQIVRYAQAVLDSEESSEAHQKLARFILTLPGSVLIPEALVGDFRNWEEQYQTAMERPSKPSKQEGGYRPMQLSTLDVILRRQAAAFAMAKASLTARRLSIVRPALSTGDVEAIRAQVAERAKQQAR